MLYGADIEIESVDEFIPVYFPAAAIACKQTRVFIRLTVTESPLLNNTHLRQMNMI